MPDKHETQTQKPDNRGRNRSGSWMNRLIPLVAVTTVMLIMVGVYLGYDYMSARAAPCEAIFRQTAINLSTKISFLKTDGEIEIGREPLVELTERAQMTALNLKTCCTVLDAGQLNPEQFLQCKAKARAYEQRVDGIVAAVHTLASSGGETATSPAVTPTNTVAAAASPAPAKPAKAAEAKAAIKSNLKEARKISQNFNKKVRDVRRAQALETLEVMKPEHVDVSAKEQEPNNDLLSTNRVELGKWITASIGAGKDYDFYSFTTPPKYRDWIKIEIDNRSTTLEPRIGLFNSDKASIGSKHQTTSGANVAYVFVAAPESTFTFRASNYYGENVGAYLVRVTALKAYDAFEPNDTILTAAPITAGQDGEAGIMDGRDLDYFKVKAGDNAKQIVVELANRSTTLRPQLVVYNPNKTQVLEKHNTTAGANLGFTGNATPGGTYYVRVSDYYRKAAGDYTLKVTFTE